MVTHSPRKQRRNLYTLPMHKRHRQLSAHLSDELLRKYKRRSMPLRVGDTVKVVRGDSKGHTGKILSVDRNAYTVQVDGVAVRQAKGTELPRPVAPSNLIITRLNLSDPRRREKLASKGVTVEAPPPEEEEPAPAPEAREPAAATTGGETQ